MVFLGKACDFFETVVDFFIDASMLFPDGSFWMGNLGRYGQAIFVKATTFWRESTEDS